MTLTSKFLNTWTASVFTQVVIWYKILRVDLKCIFYGLKQDFVDIVLLIDLHSISASHYVFLKHLLAFLGLYDSPFLFGIKKSLT